MRSFGPNSNTANILKIVSNIAVMLIVVLLLQVMIFGGIEMFEFRGFRDHELKINEDLTDEEKLSLTIQSSYISYLTDGTLHLQCYNPEFLFGKDVHQAVLDREGNVLWKTKDYSDDHSFKYLDFTVRISELWKSQRNHYKNNLRISPGMIYNFVYYVDSDKNRKSWLYLPDKNYFVCYDKNNSRIAYAGINGFADTPDQVIPFEQYSYTGIMNTVSSRLIIWYTPEKLYLIDFNNRTIETVFETEDDPIVLAGLYNPGNGRYGFQRTISLGSMVYAVTESGRFSILFSDADDITTFDIPSELVKPGQLQLAVLDDKIFLVNKPGNLRYDGYYYDCDCDDYYCCGENAPDPEKPHTYFQDLYEVKDGSIERIDHFEWTTVPQSRAYTNYKSHEERSKEIFKYITSISPVVYFPAAFFTHDLKLPGNIHPFFNIVKEAFSYTAPVLLWVNIAVSVLMAAVAFFHGLPRRTSDFQLIGWVVFVLLFNLAGLLSYLSLNHFPVIKCSHCGKRRHVKSLNCPSCGKPLSKPETRYTDLIMT